MDEVASERFRVGRVVGRAFAIWGRQLPLLLALAVVVHAPRIACEEVLARAWPFPPPPDVRAPAGRAETRDAWSRWMLSCISIKSTRSLLRGLFVDLSLALVIFAVYARLRGRHAGFTECARGGFRRFVPVLRVSVALSLLRAAYWGTWTLVFWLVLWSPPAHFPYGAVLSTLVTIAPALLLVLLGPFWVAVPAAVAAEPRGLLRGSWRLTRGHRLAVCAILLLLYATDWGSTRLIGMGLRSADLPWLARKAIWWTQDLLVVSLTAVFAAVGYHALRLEKDGVDVSDLKEIFA